MSSTYQQILDKHLLPILIDLGFARVELADCMRPEVLLRKENLWFGTSWDYRDQYLELNIGGLYWLKDVMPRVVVLGEYADAYPAIKHISQNKTDYLERVVQAIKESVGEAIQSTSIIQESELRGAARLRPLLLGKVMDSELDDYEA